MHRNADWLRVIIRVMKQDWQNFHTRWRTPSRSILNGSLQCILAEYCILSHVSPAQTYLNTNIIYLTYQYKYSSPYVSTGQAENIYKIIAGLTIFLFYATADINISHQDWIWIRCTITYFRSKVKTAGKQYDVAVRTGKQYDVVVRTKYLESTFRCRWTFRNQRIEWWGTNNDTANVNSCQPWTST